ncbi:MAG TPA: glycosyltransferase family 39 protein [Pseudonocardiaceae bacterium]|nr:glycosyltransferase family 39 protein [Pseudonocardiaceae bacterium]
MTSEHLPQSRADMALSEPWCRWTWLVGLLAFVVRVTVVAVQPVKLFNDSADYQRLAVSLAHGHGFGMTQVAPGGGPTAFRPPLFPLALGALYKVIGVHLAGARLVEALAGAIAVVLLTVVTWLLWGRAIGLTAGVAAAVFPPQLMASTSLMSESLALPLEMATLLAALAYRRSGRIGYAWGAGAGLGLLVLTRPSLAVLVVPVIILLYRHRPSLRALAAAGVVVLAGVFVVTPWLVRDRLTMHAWIPLTTQDGYVLSGTYNPASAADPRFPGIWRPPVSVPSLQRLMAAHPHAGEVETSALLQSAALHYLRQHPSYEVTVVVQNTLRLFDLAPLNETRSATYSDYGYGAPWGNLEIVSGWAVLALAIAGVLTRAGRRTPIAIFLAPVLLWLGTIVFQSVPRFRAVIDPFLIEFAAVAIVSTARAVLRRRRTPPVPAHEAFPAPAAVD